MHGAQLRFASLLSVDRYGTPVAPSRVSLAACSPDVSGIEALGGNTFPEEGTDHGCYPLSVTLSLVMARSFNGTDCARGQATLEYLHWLSSSTSLQLHSLLPLLPMSAISSSLLISAPLPSDVRRG
jgi:hypothetical protein